MRTIMIEAAATPGEKEYIRNLGGRPTLDPSGEASVSWRVRVPSALDAKFRAVARAQGRSFSAVLRSAAEEYVAAHDRTS